MEINLIAILGEFVFVMEGHWKNEHCYFFFKHFLVDHFLPFQMDVKLDRNKKSLQKAIKRQGQLTQPHNFSLGSITSIVTQHLIKHP